LNNFIFIIMKRTKFIKPKGATKFVRINDKTLIEISVEIPDDVARDKYFKNIIVHGPITR
jgi:hypothetical protein